MFDGGVRPRRLMTARFGASETSIAVPRWNVVPPSVEIRAMMSPELLMVTTSVPTGVAAPLLATRMPYAVAAPPLLVIASTLIEPELVIVMLLTPLLTRMPVAFALEAGLVVTTVVVPPP